MKRSIKKVAVLGSGIMGSRIACHFANIGIQTLLLDITPKELTPEEKAKGLTLEHPSIKNKIVLQALQSTLKSAPAALYDSSFASRIHVGNFIDDMNKIAECDWIIEAVVENLTIKQSVFEQVEKYRKPGTLITSNTSGIPIHLMIQGRSEDFQAHFCGTHFFNPPRYLRLLEIIPTPKTSSEVIAFLMHYGDLFLGKTTVLCKDTPAFIANRVGIYSMMKVIDTMIKLKLTVDEVDKLTGPIIGRPKSATFRTSDVIGLDLLIKVATNLYDGLPNDESRNLFKLPEFITKMATNQWVGDKTGQGFYKKTKGEKGETVILTLDLTDFQYKPQKKSKFATLETTKSVEHVKDRFKILLAGTDNAAEFYKHTFFGLFEYISHRIPEISDELHQIDEALKTGFGWEVGPFETWDLIDVEKTTKKMEEMGYKPATWVYDMLAKGCTSFYKSENGVRQFYNISSKSYQPIPGTEGFILLDTLRQTKTVWGNTGSTLFDIGDGILNLEFHTKMNTMGTEVVEGIHKAIDRAEKDFRGLVIGNEGANFSAGANLAMLLMHAAEQEFDEIELMVRQFQKTILRARYSSIPVITATSGLTLGGGCELSLHADYIQAHAETYIGLVETGVGLIPAGGGTKEMVLRISDLYEEGDTEMNALQNAFMTIAMAKVATSAHEAIDMNILRKNNSITLNRDRLIADAKKKAIELAEAGYTQPAYRSAIKVQGKSGLALFKAAIHGMRMGKYISEHDAKVADKLAYVMCGGDLSYPQYVSETYLLDLEREAFVSLTGEKKTLERIQSILTTGKPLRN